MDWFEDDTFWRDLEGFLFPAERIAAADREIDEALTLAGRAVDTALDLCCGPGRHAIALARRGVRVTGVDRTAAYLDTARSRAAEAGIEVEWVQDDMRRFRREGAFDLVLNVFTSFGYFEDEDDDRSVLANVRESLRPGGVFLVDVVPREWVVQNFRDTTSWDLADGSVLFERHRLRDAWLGLENEWTLVRGKAAATYLLRLHLYSAAELQDRLGEAGFDDVRLFAGLEGSPYGPGSKRLVARAAVAAR